MENLIATVDGTQMWDVRYKYPYHSFENEGKRVTYYTHAGAKCVAPTAERAIELVRAFNPEAVILGVHHRDGGEKNRVLIDPAVMPEVSAIQKQEPVAFAVQGDGFEYVSLVPEMCGAWAEENGGRTIPLYSEPQIVLTPEEREALKWAAFEANRVRDFGNTRKAIENLLGRADKAMSDSITADCPKCGLSFAVPLGEGAMDAEELDAIAIVAASLSVAVQQMPDIGRPESVKSSAEIVDRFLKRMR